MRTRAVGLFLLLCVCILFGPRPPAWAQRGRVATLISVQGNATVRRSGAGAFTDAARKMTLAAGDVVRTGPNGRAILLFSDGSQVKLNANTVLLIPAASPGRGLPSRLGLSAGEIWARITRGGRTRIETPGALAWVRGTELNLVAAPEATTLTVAGGKVLFENAQGSVRVGEGEQSVARPGQAPTLPATVNVPFVIQWTNDVQPVALLLETSYVSQDPVRLEAARRDAEALPAGPARSLRLADILHDRGELPEALAAYEAARRPTTDDRRPPDGPPPAANTQHPTPNTPTSALIEARIGQTLLELGKLAEAEAAFRRSLSIADLGGREGSQLPSPNPQSAIRNPQSQAWAGLVITLLSRRRNAEALREAQAAVEREPRAPVAHTALALVHVRGGDRDRAHRELAEALALDPNDAQAHAWRSFLLRAEGRLEEARATAQRAVALAPYSSLARQSLSDAAFALGDTPKAREEARRAVTLNPLSPGAHVSLGRALLQEGELAVAEREANQAVALDPDLERARFFRGVVLAEQRRLDRAAAELQRAVELDPAYLGARAFLARVYLEQGRRDAAVAVVQEAITRDAAFAPARAALGRVYWQSGRLKEAASEYRRALDLAPASALYHLELARVYLDQNNLPDALANGLAGVSAAPGSSEAHAVLGLVYDRTDNREQALRQYREALSFSSENALAHIGLGLLLLNTQSGARLAEAAQAGLEERTGDGIRETAQAALRDPSVASLLFKPGVTTEITPITGSHDLRSYGVTHRDAYLRGNLHDLSAGSEG